MRAYRRGSRKDTTSPSENTYVARNRITVESQHWRNTVSYTQTVRRYVTSSPNSLDQTSPVTGRIQIETPNYMNQRKQSCRQLRRCEETSIWHKPNKSSGPDQTPCRLLRELATELAPVLTSFFRQSLTTGQLPQVWTNTWISPILQKLSRCQPENYRPVSLTCIRSYWSLPTTCYSE